MGEPQSRKRKFKSGKVNNNEVKDVEMVPEDVTQSEVSKKTKKAKKNKSVEKPVDENIPNETDDGNDGDAKPKKAKMIVEPSNKVISDTEPKPKKKKTKKNKSKVSAENDEPKSGLVKLRGLTEEMLAKYPILKDEDLVKKFLAVSMTNNQKGRTRAAFRDKLKGTSEAILPEVIHTRMQAILKIPEPSDTDMRKLRILFNMLKSAVKGNKFVKKEPVKKVKEVKKKDNAEEKDNSTEEKKEDGKDKKPEQKVKGPKRYVVFIGNLSLDISEEKILEHFSDLSGQIVNVRIPKPLEGKKSAIAYLEVKDEVSYELALSKHHSMLDNKRINVLYSTQQNSKISKAEAKGKAAKLVAMQKSGQLAGSVPLNKKRSARRKKMKLAQKAQEALEAA